jgi:alkylation response protein AidB-like acyl-CoA dehydrogenase
VSDSSFLSWPFFAESHRVLARRLDAWAAASLGGVGHDDVDAACRTFVARFAREGWLAHVVPAPYGGAAPAVDVRTLCLAREILARHDPLADFAFAMQGLGAGPIALFGSDAQKARYLPRVATGTAIAAFALSEEHAGSDISAMKTTARRDGDGWRLDGEKTWISNGGIADFYVVFARVEEGGESGTFAAFVVDAETAGLTVRARLESIAPHPLGRIALDRCRVSGAALIDTPGKGLRVALGTLDVFRATVGAAALGMARRALDEALRFAATRVVSGKPLAEHQLTQARIAEMATAIDASALLVYRSAWARDVQGARVTRQAAMAKWYATEAAQRVIDSAVQLLGGRGVESGTTVERLYREIRSLRIYEGTSEIQQLVIAAQVMKEHAQPSEGE